MFRVRQIGIARSRRIKCQHIDVGEAKVFALGAVVDTVLKGANARNAVLQRPKGIRNLANLLVGSLRLVLEYNDVPQWG